MIKSKEVTGHVGKRGTIVLPAASRRRYGLEDGALFISQETSQGILIRPAEATPKDLSRLRTMIQEGLDALERGEKISGEEAYAHMKRKSAEFRAAKRK